MFGDGCIPIDCVCVCQNLFHFIQLVRFRRKFWAIPLPSKFWWSTKNKHAILCGSNAAAVMRRCAAVPLCTGVLMKNLCVRTSTLMHCINWIQRVSFWICRAQMTNGLTNSAITLQHDSFRFLSLSPRVAPNRRVMNVYICGMNIHEILVSILSLRTECCGCCYVLLSYTRFSTSGLIIR